MMEIKTLICYIHISITSRIYKLKLIKEKETEKRLIPREQLNRNKKGKHCRPGFIESVHEIRKSATPLTSPNTGLNGMQFSTLNELKSLIPMDQKPRCFVASKPKRYYHQIYIHTL